MNDTYFKIYGEDILPSFKFLTNLYAANFLPDSADKYIVLGSTNDEHITLIYPANGDMKRMLCDIETLHGQVIDCVKKNNQLIFTVDVAFYYATYETKFSVKLRKAIN